MEIEQVIGDYKNFSSDLFKRLTAADINIQGLPLSHICYRVNNFEEYKIVSEQLKHFSRAWAEHEFGGRLVSEFILKNPLSLEEGGSVRVVELLPSKAGSSYSRGLQNIGIIVGKNLLEFNEKYKNVLTGIKNRSPHCKPSFITFENGKTAKFYDQSLENIVRSDGIVFKVIQ